MSKTNEVIRTLKRYHLNLVERPHEVDKHVEKLFNTLRTIGTMDQVLTAMDEIELQKLYQVRVKDRKKAQTRRRRAIQATPKKIGDLLTRKLDDGYRLRG